MKNNSTLIATFTVAAGLISSTALAGVDAGTSAVGGTADRQPVKMLTDKGLVDDVIDWGAVGTRTSTVTEVPLLDFLIDSREIKKDVDYRPFESAAAFAPADFRDRRNVTLDEFYPDDPKALLASRERPAFVIAPAVVDRIAAYQARSNYLDEEGHVDTPTDRLQLAALEDRARVMEVDTPLTAEEILALLKSGDIKDEKLYMALKREYSNLLASEKEGVGYIPDLALIGFVRDIKAAEDETVQIEGHTAFHNLSDKIDIVTTPESECSFSPCIVHYLTPSDVWDGGTRPDTPETEVDAMIDVVTETVDEVVTVPLTIGDIAPSKFHSKGSSADSPM
ncbi:MAG: hypothetical protein K8R48_01970 [Alphaproteobacteria bacterium]|nr:hypothetical protein [Alphaproteobacteria bacterium]